MIMPTTSVDNAVEQVFVQCRRKLLVDRQQNPWRVSYWRLHENEAYQGLVSLGSKAFPYFQQALVQGGSDALFLATAVVAIVRAESQVQVSDAFRDRPVEEIVNYTVGLINKFSGTT